MGPLQYEFMRHALAAALLGGLGCGLVGVFIVTLRIPFLSVAMSHAAFAGAVLGLLAGVSPLACGILLCAVCAGALGPFADRAGIHPELSIGILFSVTIGLAFLGLGMLEGPRTEALGLFWGNILAVSAADIRLMAAVAVLLVAGIVLFFKEIQAIAFHRESAAAAGIPEKAMLYGVFLVTGVVIALTLNTIGGLLVFGLIYNPPAAACQLTYSLRRMFLLSALFAIASCLLGLTASYWLNLPSGAVIILASSAIFGICILCSPKRAAR
ncbi:MAG: metal ABC transporter permease [bacterium]|nr:metal ABC transporter permease [bacterium]